MAFTQARAPGCFSECINHGLLLPWLLLSLFCSRSFHLRDVLTTIGEKVSLEVSRCLALCGAAPCSPGKETALRGQIQALGSSDNPIRRLMGTCEGKQVVGLLACSPGKPRGFG